MNISNTISYDSTKPAESTYSKNALSDRKVQQNIPKPVEGSKFSDSLEKPNKSEKINTKEQLNEIKDIVDQTNEQFRTYDRRLDISVHEKTSQVMVKIVDTSTDKIIRELPPEEVLDTLAKRKEFLGILMDKQI